MGVIACCDLTMLNQCDFHGTDWDSVAEISLWVTTPTHCLESTFTFMTHLFCRAEIE